MNIKSKKKKDTTKPNGFYLHPVHQVHDGIITTFSGKKVSLLNPTPDMICIEDIAHGLAYENRFGNQRALHYSVAQHSILVSCNSPESIRKEALLHDATEAYISDVIKPLKVILGTKYNEIERKFQYAIVSKFKLDFDKLSYVKKYDKIALENENDAMIKGDALNYWQVISKWNQEEYERDKNSLFFLSTMVLDARKAEYEFVKFYCRFFGLTKEFSLILNNIDSCRKRCALTQQI